jgi:hypothetical protein
MALHFEFDFGVNLLFCFFLEEDTPCFVYRRMKSR